MASRHDPKTPRRQTSAPVRPPRTTRDVTRERDEERRPARKAGQDAAEGAVRGDRMPAGADEPGAGL